MWGWQGRGAEGLRLKAKTNRSCIAGSRIGFGADLADEILFVSNNRHGGGVRGE